MPNVKPTRDVVIVKPVAPEEVSKGGIFIPQTGSDDQKYGSRAMVVACGPKVKSDLKRGQLVIHNRYAGSEFKFGDERLLVMREEDIVAMLHPEEGEET